MFERDRPAGAECVESVNEAVRQLRMVAHGVGKTFHVIVENTVQLTGDIDRNGTVGFLDYLTLSRNFGRGDASWEDGDFNGDQVVSFADFLLLSKNFA